MRQVLVGPYNSVIATCWSEGRERSALGNTVSTLSVIFRVGRSPAEKGACTQSVKYRLVVPNQLIDYTYGRDLSFFEDEIHHIDFTEPYDPGLRLGILRAVDQVTGDYPDLVVAREGVYGCTQGPRLETAAEIRRLFRDGCTIVGMTAMPEAALAREMGMPYAGISVTVNPGPGLAPGEVVLEDIEAAMDQGLAWVKAILLEFMAAAA